MKKFLLSLAFIAASIGAWAADDAVTAKVSGTSLNIGLTNEATYVAFQMDITLPSGVTATEVAAVADRLSQEGSDTEIGGTKFIVAYNVIDETNNVLRVIAYNLNNAAITGTSGDDILKITLSGDVADPTTITVSNILFVTADDLAEVEFKEATGENGTVKGDVNVDGSVNIYDVAGVLTFMKGGDTTGLSETAADVNNDGTINVYDVAAILEIMKK